MTTDDHRRQHPAAVIVHGLLAADPAPSLAESAAAIAGPSLDVSLEVMSSAAAPREVFILISGPSTEAAARAITAAPARYGLARATLTDDLNERSRPSIKGTRPAVITPPLNSKVCKEMQAMNRSGTAPDYRINAFAPDGPWHAPGHFRAGDAVCSLYDGTDVVVIADDCARDRSGVLHLPAESSQLSEIRHTGPGCAACAGDIAGFEAYQALHASAWDLLYRECDGDVHQLQRGYGCAWAVIDWAALITAHPDLLVAADTTVSLDAFVRAFEVLQSSAPWASLSIELWCCGDGRIEVEPTVLEVHSDQQGVSVPDDIAARCTHILQQAGWTGQTRTNPDGDSWWTVC